MDSQKIIYVLVFIGFMSACTHKTNNYYFGKTDSVKVDESKVVLTRFPSQIDEINDSVIGAINSYQKLSLYNIYSGKNIANFSTEKVNMDSLIQNTFQKKYTGEKKFIYDRKNAGGLSDGNAQVNLFQYSGNTFYIHVRTQAEIVYLKDSTELLEYEKDEKVKQLKKRYKDVKIHSFDYLNFLFVTDNSFNLKEIIPLYENPTLKSNHYFPIYEKAFAVHNNNAYVYLIKDDESYETMRSEKQLQPYYLAKIDLKNEQKSEFLLSNNDIDFNDFTINDYYAASFKFFENDGNILYTNSKDICEVENGRKVFSRKDLRSNEWIEDFYVHNKNIVMFNYNVNRKKHPTEFDEHYVVDSISDKKIRIFNTQNLQWSTEKEIKVLSMLAVSITKDKIIYVDKDKQNYYFKYIRYNEN